MTELPDSGESNVADTAWPVSWKPVEGENGATGLGVAGPPGAGFPDNGTASACIASGGKIPAAGSGESGNCAPNGVALAGAVLLPAGDKETGASASAPAPGTGAAIGTAGKAADCVSGILIPTTRNACGIGGGRVVCTTGAAIALLLSCACSGELGRSGEALEIAVGCGPTGWETSNTDADNSAEAGAADVAIAGWVSGEVGSATGSSVAVGMKTPCSTCPIATGGAGGRETACAVVTSGFDCRVCVAV